MDGSTFALSSLRGQVAVVNFFATWCFPCLLQLPQLAELQRREGPKGLQVVAIGMDLEGPLVLRPFAAQYRFPFPVLYPTDQMRSGSSPFGPIQALPSTFVIDREGRIAAAFAGPAAPDALTRLVEGLLLR